MMILALVGSGRIDGSTARVVGLLEAYLRREAERAGEPFAVAGNSGTLGSIASRVMAMAR